MANNDFALLNSVQIEVIGKTLLTQVTNNYWELEVLTETDQDMDSQWNCYVVKGRRPHSGDSLMLRPHGPYGSVRIVLNLSGNVFLAESWPKSESFNILRDKIRSLIGEKEAADDLAREKNREEEKIKDANRKYLKIMNLLTQGS